MLKIIITQETPQSDVSFSAIGNRHPSEVVAVMAAALEEIVLDAHHHGTIDGTAAFSGVVTMLRDAREKLRAEGGEKGVEA